MKFFVYVCNVAIPSNIFLELRWDIFSIEYHLLCICFSLLTTYIGICNMFILWLCPLHQGGIDNDPNHNQIPTLLTKIEHIKT